MSRKIKDKYLKVKLNVYNIKDELIGKLNTNPKNQIWNFEKVITRNDVNTINFSIYSDNGIIDKGSNEMKIKIEGENETYILKINDITDSDKATYKVTCYHKLDSSKSLYIDAVDEVGKTPLEMFEEVITSCSDFPNVKNIYKWQGTDVVDSKGALQIESGTVSLFEGLIKIAEEFNGWWVFTEDENGLIWFYLKTISTDNKRYLVKGSGLQELNIKMDSSEIKTKMYCYGATDKITGEVINILQCNPTKQSYITNYDYFKALGVTDSQIENDPQFTQSTRLEDSRYLDDVALYEHCVRELEKISVPKITGSININDTSIYEDSSWQEPEIGEKIIIIDSDIDFKFECEIDKITRKYTEIISDVPIEISNFISYSNVFKNLIHTSQIVDRTTVIGDDGNPYVDGDKVVNITNARIEGNLVLHDVLDDLEATIDFNAKQLTSTFEDHANNLESQIIQTASEISQYVRNDEMGSYFIHHADQFKYAFDNISDYITIEPTGIYARNELTGGYSRLGSNGFEYLSDKMATNGGIPYKALVMTLVINIKCSQSVSGYTITSTELPALYSGVPEKNITTVCFIRKNWKEGRFVKYWEGAYATIQNGRVWVSGMSSWRDIDSDFAISYDGNLEVGVILIA